MFPKFCPQCGRGTVLRAYTADEKLDNFTFMRFYRCTSCKSRFSVHTIASQDEKPQHKPIEEVTDYPVAFLCTYCGSGDIARRVRLSANVYFDCNTCGETFSKTNRENEKRKAYLNGLKLHIHNRKNKGFYVTATFYAYGMNERISRTFPAMPESPHETAEDCITAFMSWFYWWFEVV